MQTALSVAGGEPGPVVENRISVIVLAGRQIIGLPRIDNDERAQRERIRQVKISAEENRDGARRKPLVRSRPADRIG